jgi:hypothetical protein
MSIPLRIPPPVSPADDHARGTQDAVRSVTTQERIERYQQEQDTQANAAIGAAGRHVGSTIEASREIRAVNARARTHTRRGLTRYVTHAGIGAALSFAAFPLVGPAWTALLGLAAFTGIRTWERSGR